MPRKSPTSPGDGRVPAPPAPGRVPGRAIPPPPAPGRVPGRAIPAPPVPGRVPPPASPGELPPPGRVAKLPPGRAAPGVEGRLGRAAGRDAVEPGPPIDGFMPPLGRLTCCDGRDAGRFMLALGRDAGRFILGLGRDAGRAPPPMCPMLGEGRDMPPEGRPPPLGLAPPPTPLPPPPPPPKPPRPCASVANMTSAIITPALPAILAKVVFITWLPCLAFKEYPWECHWVPHPFRSARPQRRGRPSPARSTAPVRHRPRGRSSLR